jgi:hypothetical protein
MLKGKLRMKVMQEVHDVPMARHYGEKTTRELLGKTFYWLEMREDIEHYVYMFVKCQSTKLVHKKSLGCINPSQSPQVHLKMY